MKKNVLPLVLIALVVAVFSTAVFYGLIVSRMDASSKSGPQPRFVSASNLTPGQTLKASDYRLSNVDDPGYASPGRAEDLNGRLVKVAIEAGKVIPESSLDAQSRAQDQSAIPEGMRALTLHISESSSVVDLLVPGDQVDVLAILTHNRSGEQELESTMVLQNAKILDIRKDANVQALQGRQVITILVSPQDIQRVAVADAGGRLRVALRNKKDAQTQTSSPTSVSSLLKTQPSAPLRPSIQSNFTPGTPTAKATKPVEFEVSLMDVPSDQTQTLAAANRADVLAVTADEADLARKLDQLRKEKKATLIASRRFSLDQAGEFTWKAEDQSTLRVRMEALARTVEGGIQLRVQPESTSPTGSNSTTQRLDSSIRLNHKQSAIVSGLLPGNKNHSGHLVVVISPVSRP